MLHSREHLFFIMGKDLDNMIKIKEISIVGWKSYDENGINLSGLKDFNLIIGPNNTGKSNLIQYFMWIYYDFSFNESYRNWLNQLKGNHNVENTWNLLGREIRSSILVEGLKDEKILKLEVTHQKDTEARFKASLLQWKGSDLKTIKRYKENSVRSYKYWKRVMDKFDHIAPQRDYNRFANSSTIGFDGSQLVSNFAQLKPEKRNKLSNILTTYLTAILGEQTIVKKIEVVPISDLNLDRHRAAIKVIRNPNKKLSRGSWLSGSKGSKFGEIVTALMKKEQRIKITIEQEREERVSLDLNDLGTGITQIVIILCYLFLRTENQGHKNLFLFIEEPECNLHNDTLIRFMKFLKSEFQHQFFVTTHSNALLDCFSTSSSAVYRVQKTSGGASRFSTCLRDLEKFYLLDDLGVTASQLLLSNCVIWVEGPTDRIYLKKWIEMQSDLRENEHFIFAMYGGKNLHHYTLMDEGNLEDWIQILKSSRYVAIVADSDGTSESQSEKNKAIQKIKNELNTSRELDDFCYIWATSNVKEIENYVPYNLLREAIEEVHKPRKYERDITLLSKDIDPYKPFAKHFADMYTGENGQILSEDEKKNVSKMIVNLKVKIARYVADNWNKKFVKQNKELEERLNKLINHIKKANRIKI